MSNSTGALREREDDHRGAPGDPGAPDARADGALSRRSALVLCAGLGILSALVTLAVAEVVAVFVGAASSPLFAVGAWIVDLAPAGFKELVIRTFGTSDKPFLFFCLGLLLLVLALAVGLLERVRPPIGSILLAAFGFVGVLAVITRPDATTWFAIPTGCGTIVGVIVLRSAFTRFDRWRNAAQTDRRVPSREVEIARRSFFLFVGLSAGVAVVAGLGARAMNAGSAAVTSLRSAVRLPHAAHPSAAVPAAADLRVAGLTPYITPAGDFYRIDTALQVPAVDPTTWKLHIGGMVENDLDLSWAQLLKLPLTEHMLTLACVSNEVGGNLIGNALWLGYPLRDLLARAKPSRGADMVLSRSVDGFTAGTPLEVLQDPGTQALLAVGMNGKPLPLEHGFPVRMVVPGLYGYVSATKWVTELTVTTFADSMGYWTDKGWSARGPVKAASRIDTPREGASIKAGRIPIAGVAWDQHVGISRVEVRVDNDEWQSAKLAESVSADTWRQWLLEWDAAPGSHTLQVRATNAAGATQTSTEAPPAPNGATGWHTVRVEVS